MEVERRYVETEDGCKLAIYSVGKKDKPIMVLSNGLGGNFGTWRHLVAFFQHKYRIVSWDYRGLFCSSKPTKEVEDSYSIQKHCEDLQKILDSEGGEKAIFVGWSMGVQVNFEFYRLYPERVVALVQINGTYGKPFESAFKAEWMRFFALHFLDVLDKGQPIIHSLAPFVSRSKAVITLLKIGQLVSPTLDEDVFYDLAGEYLKLDFSVYTKIFRKLGEHSAEDILDKIHVPTLIITGEKDLFTPLHLSEYMQKLIKDSELLVIKGGTHYTPVEYPMVVNMGIERFLNDRVKIS